jgi:hypothetical protein
MITFLQLGNLGRLGNQLFQYAALKSLGLTKGYEVKIPNPSGCEWHGQECLLKHFNIKADFLTNEDYKKIKYLIKEADHSKFYKSIFNIPDNSDLYGYFQNYQYFSSCEKQIREEFTLSIVLCKPLKTIFSNTDLPFLDIKNKLIIFINTHTF